MKRSIAIAFRLDTDDPKVARAIEKAAEKFADTVENVTMFTDNTNSTIAVGHPSVVKPAIDMIMREPDETVTVHGETPVVLPPEYAEIDRELSGRERLKRGEQ